MFFVFFYKFFVFITLIFIFFYFDSAISFRFHTSSFILLYHLPIDCFWLAGATYFNVACLILSALLFPFSFAPSFEVVAHLLRAWWRNKSFFSNLYILYYYSIYLFMKFYFHYWILSWNECRTIYIVSSNRWIFVIRLHAIQTDFKENYALKLFLKP